MHRNNGVWESCLRKRFWDHTLYFGWESISQHHIFHQRGKFWQFSDSHSKNRSEKKILEEKSFTLAQKIPHSQWKERVECEAAPREVAKSPAACMLNLSIGYGRSERFTLKQAKYDPMTMHSFILWLNSFSDTLQDYSNCPLMWNSSFFIPRNVIGPCGWQHRK